VTGLALCNDLLTTELGRRETDRTRYSALLRQGDFYLLHAQAGEMSRQSADQDYARAKQCYEQARLERRQDYPAYEALTRLHVLNRDLAEANSVLNDYRLYEHSGAGSKHGDIKGRADQLEYRTAEILEESGLFEEASELLVRMLATSQPANTKAAALLVSLVSLEFDRAQAASILKQFLAMRAGTTARAMVISTLVSELGVGRDVQLSPDVANGSAPQTHEFLAKYYFDLGRNEAPGSPAQLEYLNTSLDHNRVLEELDPARSYDVVAWTRRARLEMFLGNLDKAKELLRSLTENFPRDNYLPFHLGECLVRERDYQGALSQFRMAYRRAPRIETAHQLAFCHLRLGNLDTAITEFNELLGKRAGDSPALHALGVAYVARSAEGDISRAIECWLECLRGRIRELPGSG